MKTRLVRIGNSRSIRLPKALLAQHKLGDAVELEVEVEDNRLVVRPAKAPPRAGWDQAFAAMAARGDDTLLDRDALKPADWNKSEWRW